MLVNVGPNHYHKGVSFCIGRFRRKYFSSAAAGPPSMHKLSIDRRDFLTRLGGTAVGVAGVWAGGMAGLHAAQNAPQFSISLAEWSVHQALFKGRMKHLDFPAFAKRECGINAVEYVNQFFMKCAGDDKYLASLKQRCADEGVTSVLIMCDGEGDLGAPDRAARTQAVTNHRKWVDAALALDCHAVRVNAHSTGTRDEQLKFVADGLRQLSEYAAPHGLNVLVENHGGFSSDGAWVAEVMRQVAMPNCGTLPDFGNFNDYDRYQGVAQMMPFAKGISAKSFRFDEEGNETETDFKRMMEIVVRAGFHGYVGIEWEGKVPAQEREGILLTKQLLERVRESLASE